MTIQLTREGVRAIFPKAPQAVVEAFVEKQAALDRAGITHTRTRLSYFFSNIEHECGGFTIPNLTEQTNYTHARVAAVWPNRFASASAVMAKYGAAPGWQLRMLDDVYGGRMGNRPGTRDGSTYIGRGGPQWTGRDGYAELERRAGVPAVSVPTTVSDFAKQPEICAAFWDWKKLNAKADVGDFKGAVKLWNGGTNGMADRLSRMDGNDPIIARLAVVDRVMPEAKALPGSPPTKEPPRDVVDDATKRERAAVKVGAGSTITGGAGEAAKTTKSTTTTTTKTEHPAAPPALLSPLVTWTLIGAGIAVVIVAAILIARKKAIIKTNWF